MEFLDLVRNFGLPLGLCLAAIGYLVKQMREILTGELMVPRWAYDELLRRLEATEKRLDRATDLAERITDDVARPAVHRARGRDDPH